MHCISLKETDMAMDFHKSYFTALVFIILNMTPAIAQSSPSWQQWQALRWAGLEEFRKNDLPAAWKHFEQALTEAKHVQPGGQNEVVSTHDLGQLYDAEGKLEQAETYCRRALELSRRIASDSPTAMLILHSLEYLKREEVKYEEVGKIEEEIDKMAIASPDSRTIGVATMESDGTITVRSRIVGAEGSIGHAINSYAVNDAEYKKVLMHVGPLKPGDSKSVTPLE
jgi:tetratricopeptide (TPR) repeat protein